MSLTKILLKSYFRRLRGVPSANGGRCATKGFQLFVEFVQKNPKNTFSTGNRVFEGNFRGWVAFGLGMNYLELAILALTIVIIGMQFLQLRFIARMIRESARSLDHSLAEAIKATIENLPGSIISDVEPINPIQQLIAQIIQDKMNPKIEAQLIETRSADGKFSKDTSS